MQEFYSLMPGPEAIQKLNDLWVRVTDQLDSTISQSLVVGLGAKHLNVGVDKQFAIGQIVRITRTSDVSVFMQGTVTSYSRTTGAMSVLVQDAQGSGTYTDWTVALAGGGQGPVGLQGPNGWSPILAAENDAERRVFKVVDWVGGAGVKPSVGSYIGSTGFVSTATLALDVRGGTGGVGPANTLAVGSVTQGSAAASITGVAPNQVLNLVLPKGDAATVSVSSTVTGAPGSDASVTNVGTSADAELVFVVPRGNTGLTGTAATVLVEATNTVSPGTPAAVTNTGTSSAVSLIFDIPQGDPGAVGDKGWSPILATVADGARFVHQIYDWTGGVGTKPAVGEYIGATGVVSDISLATNIRGAAGSGSGDVSGPLGATAGNLAVYADSTGKLLADGPAVSNFATAAQGAKADSAVQPDALGTSATLNAGVANGTATLDATGKVPSAQMPPIAITETFVVASQIAQLALTAQEGDVAVRTDLSKTYIKNSGTSGTMADWSELLAPGAPVQSVNGQTGTVSLAASDVGAKPVAYAPSASEIAGPINAATAKPTPVDADTLPLLDSADSNSLKKWTWANLKAAAKTYFDTLYAATGRGLPTGGTTGQVLTKASDTDYAAAWADAGGSGYETGDIVLSARTLSEPDYLALNSVYLQSSYPALSSILPPRADGDIGGSATWYASDLVTSTLDITRVTNTIVVAALGPSGLARSTDGGKSWTAITGPTGTFRAVARITDLVVLAMNHTGGCWRSADAGLTWTLITSAALTGVSFNCVARVTDLIVLAGGGSGKLVRSADAGLTWGAVTGFGTSNIQSISPLTASIVIATGAGLSPMRSINSGVSFSSSSGGAFGNIAFCSRVSDTVALATGNNSAGGVQNMRSTDAGVTWASVSIAFSSSGIARATGAISETTVMAVGDGGRCSRSTDAGATWSVVTGLAGNSTCFAKVTDSNILVGGSSGILRSLGTTYNPNTHFITPVSLVTALGANWGIKS